MGRLRITYQSFGFIQELMIDLNNPQSVKRAVEILRKIKHEKITCVDSQ